MHADSYAVKTDTPDCHQMFFSASYVSCDGSRMHPKCSDYGQIQISVIVAEIRKLPVCVQGLRYLLFNTSLCWKKNKDGEMHTGSEWSVILPKWRVVFVSSLELTYDVEMGSKPQQTLFPEEKYIMCHSNHLCLRFLPLQMSTDAPTGVCSWGSGLVIPRVLNDAQKIFNEFVFIFSYNFYNTVYMKMRQRLAVYRPGHTDKTLSFYPTLWMTQTLFLLFAVFLLLERIGYVNLPGMLILKLITH